MKLESRPRCQCCHGAGTIPDWFEPDCAVECQACDGQGFDPYWRGPEPTQGEQKP